MMWSSMWAEWAQDLRYGLRVLARSPGFALVASATLALGIGASASIFSVVHAVLWKPLPYLEPGRLVQLWETNPDRGWADAECAPANVQDWQRLNRSFVGLAPYSGAGRDPVLSNLALTGVGDPTRVKGMAVAGNFFAVLGVEAAVGRTFFPAEEWQGQDDVVVLSDAFWRARFGGARGILGRSIQLNGRSRTVIGILPASFTFGEKPVDLWIPMGWTRSQVASARLPHILRVVGRLKPGISIEQARADLQAIARDLEQAYPATNRHMGVGVGSLTDWVVVSARAPLLILFGAVGLVMLIACANFANLLMARGVARERELAVRAALGASTSRLVRQLTTETLLLASIGGVAGTLGALAAVRLMTSLGPASLPRLHEVAIDRSTLLFALTVTAFTGIVFGVLPAKATVIGDTAEAVRAGRHGGAPSRSRARKALVVIELALSVALMTGAALLTRSFVKLNQVDPGFQSRDVVSFQLSLPRSTYPDAVRQLAFIDQVVTRVRELPGVETAAAAQRLVLNGLWSSDFTIERRPPTEFGIEVHHNAVTPGYFQTIGVPIVSGRDIAEQDAPGIPLVVVVNEALVRQYFGQENPIGHRLNFDRPGGTSPWRTIVGVVRDFHEEQVNVSARPTIYEALLQIGNPNPGVVLRTSRKAAEVARSLRSAVRDVDPNMPIGDLRSLDAQVHEQLTPQRFTSTLMTSFALGALLLAAIGLGGVLSFLAAERTREIGVRIALGATRGDIERLMANYALQLVGGGLILGLALALAAGRLLRGLLFGVEPTDPVAYLLVVAALAVVASIATSAPICRALSVSPLEALRSE